MKLKMRAPTAMARVMELMRMGKPAEATALIRSGLEGGGLPPQTVGLGGLSGVPGAKPPAAADGMIRGSVESGHGRRSYALHVPDRPMAEPALIVMLHGCTQSAADFARGTRMNALAGAEGFHVLWPEQSREANAMGCWNWFDPGHQAADAGEPALIAQMIDTVCAEQGIARGRVCVAGLSAGGAMAAVLAATMPEVFAAAAVHSGLAAGSARSMPEALSVMKSGPGQPRGASTPRVPHIVFHGSADRTVVPENGSAVAAGLGHGAPEAGQVGGRRYSRSVGPMGELWQIDGLAHAWSGGDSAGSYADPAGPDASAEIVRFFRARLAAADVIDL